MEFLKLSSWDNLLPEVTEADPFKESSELGRGRETASEGLLEDRVSRGPTLKGPAFTRPRTPPPLKVSWGPRQTTEPQASEEDGAFSVGMPSALCPSNFLLVMDFSTV